MGILVIYGTFKGILNYQNFCKRNSFYRIKICKTIRDNFRTPLLEKNNLDIYLLPDTKNDPNAVFAPWGNHAKRGRAAYKIVPDNFEY